MGKHSNDIINIQFTKVFNEVLRLKLVPNKSQFAYAIGKRHHEVHYYLQGKRPLTITVVHNISNAFNVNTNFLFGRSEVMFKNLQPKKPKPPSKGNIVIMNEQKLIEKHSA